MIVRSRRIGERAGRRGAFGTRLALAGALLLGAATTVVGGVGVPPATAQDASPATAGVVPETALLYVTVNLDLESDQWRRVDGLLARVGFPTAVDDGRRAIEDELRQDPATAGIDVNDLLGGELGIVVTEPALLALADPAPEGPLDPAIGEGADPSGRVEVPDAATPVADGTPAPSPFGPPTGVAAVLSAGDPDAAFSLLDEELRGAALEGDRVAEIDHRGTEIVALVSGSALARVDDLVLFAETPADLEPLIDTAAGETPTLVDFGPMTDALDTLPDETALFGFVNGERIADALDRYGADLAEFNEVLAAVGPNAAGAAPLDFHAAFALWADDPGLRFDTVVLPPVGGTLPPAPANIETTADERVTADSLFFASGNDLGADGSLDVLALTIAMALTEGMGDSSSGSPIAGVGDELSPEAIEERFAAAERLLGFDLRADLFDQPVGEYVLAASAGDVFRGEGFGFVFASEVAEPTVVAGSLRRVARLIESAGGGMVDVTTRQVADETVFVARLEGAEDEITFTSPPLDFGVVDDQVVVGLGSGLDDYTSGPAESLADDEQYRRVMATLPSEHSQVAYFDLRFVASPLGALLGSIDLDGSGAEPADADPACAAYDGEAAAQGAYDADPIANGELDQDFDDLACDDFFAGATPAATPVVVGDPAALEALASVSYTEDGAYRSRTILYIAEP